MLLCAYPLRPEVGVLGLLLAGVGPVHGIVLLKLHRLHLLLDGVHGGGCSVAAAAAIKEGLMEGLLLPHVSIISGSPTGSSELNIALY